MKKKLISILLTLVLVLTLMPAMSLRVEAATDTYTALIPTNTDNDEALANKVVHFNGYNWYIIKDESSAVDAGTVTLLAKDPIGASIFDESSKEYKDSDVKEYLEGLTTGNGSFADVANAIVGTDLIDVGVTGAKLWLLSTTDANKLSSDVKKCNQATGAEHNYWWLRSPFAGETLQAMSVDSDGNDECMLPVVSVLGVRPALKLNLEKVVFDSGSKTFSLKTSLGTGAMANPSAPEEDKPWNGSYVYYGKYDGTTPTKYRVLDKASSDFGVTGGSLLLECDSVLYEAKFDENGNPNEGAQYPNEWAHSDVKAGLNGDAFLSKDGNFTYVEKGAIAESTKSNPIAGKDGDGEDPYLPYVELSGEKVFLLDAKEATRITYGYSNTPNHAYNRVKSGHGIEWWLRSPYFNNPPDDGHFAGRVDARNGIIHTTNVSGEEGITTGVSPAFNVSLSSVIFSSLVSGTSGQAGAEYKLTLKDPNLTIAAGAVQDETVNNKYHISYDITDNSSVSTPTQVSVVVTDGIWNNGWDNVSKFQYTKLDVDSFAATGTGTFTLDTSKFSGTWGTDYHVYVLAEDVNGAKETDFASAPVEIEAIPSYLLKYAPGDGGTGSMASVNVCDNDMFTFPACGFTALEGKSFDHWEMSGVDNSRSNLDANGDPVDGVFAPGSTIKIASNCAIDGIITVTANWKDVPKPPSPPAPPAPSPTYYTVKFEMNGHGEQVASQSIRSGQRAKEPSAPTAEEYYFAGWFEDEELTKEYDFSSPIRKNTTLYARWEEILYVVSFDLDGKGSIEPQWVRKNGMAVRPEEPTAEGYTFDGWYSGDVPYDFSTPVTEDITIYAKWEEVVPPVVVHRLYNPNSGEHFYTANDDERDGLVSAGWSEENGFMVTGEGIPVYRLYNPNGNDHHFTADRREAEAIKAAGWVDEGIAFYTSSDGIPVYRAYNPYAGHHFFTADREEFDYLITLGWITEGIAWYAVLGDDIP